VPSPVSTAVPEAVRLGISTSFLPGIGKTVMSGWKTELRVARNSRISETNEIGTRSPPPAAVDCPSARLPTVTRPPSTRRCIPGTWKGFPLFNRSASKISRDASATISRSSFSIRSTRSAVFSRRSPRMVSRYNFQ